MKGVAWVFVVAGLGLAGCATKPEPAASTPAKVPPPAASKAADVAPEFGMKLYPGMKLMPDSLVTTTTPEGESSNANYTTPDPVEKVVEFYQKELGPTATVERNKSADSEQAVVLKTDATSVQSATVNRNKGEDVTTVSLTKNVRPPAKG